eukprot:SAG22_NODE_8344_length_662_cov_1.291297_1_plen_145_part_10
MAASVLRLVMAAVLRNLASAAAEAAGLSCPAVLHFGSSSVVSLRDGESYGAECLAIFTAAALLPPAASSCQDCSVWLAGRMADCRVADKAMTAAAHWQARADAALAAGLRCPAGDGDGGLCDAEICEGFLNNLHWPVAPLDHELL